MNDREQFEAAVCSIVPRPLFLRNEDGSYQEIMVQGFWSLWKAARATPAQPVGDLHNAIMNLPCNALHAASPNQEVHRAYKEGYRDARHAAAELVAAYEMECSQPSPSSVGAAIRKLPLPDTVVMAGCHGDIEVYTPDQMRAILSEAAALAEQMQGQQWRDLTQDEASRIYLKWQGAGETTEGLFQRFKNAAMLATAPSIAQDGQKSEGV